MKFGTEVVLEGRKVLGRGCWPHTPTPGYGVRKGGTGCLWSLSHVFWQKLHKTEVAGHPWFSGSVTFLGPMSFWSIGHSLWVGVDKTNIGVYDPNSYLVGLDTLYPDPQGPGGPKGGGGLEPQPCIFGTYLDPKSGSGRTWLCFWSCGAPFIRRVYKMKVVSILNGYFLSIGQDHRDRALAWRGLEGPAGPWKANVWLSQLAWVIKLNLTNNYYLKSDLNHPGQCRVTQASWLY